MNDVSSVRCDSHEIRAFEHEAELHDKEASPTDRLGINGITHPNCKKKKKKFQVKMDFNGLNKGLIYTKMMEKKRTKGGIKSVYNVVRELFWML